MKKWSTPSVEELSIEETAFGWYDTKRGPGHSGPGHGGPGHGGPHHPIHGEGVGTIPGVFPGDVETDGLS